jgi:hypothetical protein
VPSALLASGRLSALFRSSFCLRMKELDPQR